MIKKTLILLSLSLGCCMAWGQSDYIARIEHSIELLERNVNIILNENDPHQRKTAYQKWKNLFAPNAIVFDFLASQSQEPVHKFKTKLSDFSSYRSSHIELANSLQSSPRITRSDRTGSDYKAYAVQTTQLIRNGIASEISRSSLIFYFSNYKIIAIRSIKDDDFDKYEDNYEDECPVTPGALNGCPDSDGDGVPEKTKGHRNYEYRDLCPGVKGYPPTGCEEGFEMEEKLVITSDPSSAKMIFINGGVFKKGRNSFQLRSFYMAPYEVTVSDYEAYCYSMDLKSPYEFVSQKNENASQLPAVNVSWMDAIHYCNWKSVQDGLEPCYEIQPSKVKTNFNRNGYRLPTEEEWEFVAQSVDSSNVSFDEQAWYGANAENRPHVVGEKIANPLGVYDMLGNVAELTNDWFTEDYRFQYDDKKDGRYSRKIIRGGHWFSIPKFCSSVYRSSLPLNESNETTGFRLVRSN